VAREVRERLVAEGHDDAHFAIVGSGPNSASPHHEASERVIAAGEPIVLDIGGTIEGYGSDITRTLWVTGGDPAKGPDERFRHLFGVLYNAQAAATRSVRPGVTAEAVDAAARGPIEAEGFGEAFFHRTGHGIGLEGHEDPYIIAGNREPLREGMAFSVEPGIYLVGEYGARIEDIVVCAPGWADRAQPGAARAVRRRRLTGGGGSRSARCGIIGRRVAPDAAGISQPRPHDHDYTAPLQRRQPGPTQPARTERPMSRRHHGRPHHQANGVPGGPRRVAGMSPGAPVRRGPRYEHGRRRPRVAQARGPDTYADARPPARRTAIAGGRRPSSPRERRARGPHERCRASRGVGRASAARASSARAERPVPRSDARPQRPVHRAAAPPVHQEPSVRADA